MGLGTTQREVVAAVQMTDGVVEADGSLSVRVSSTKWSIGGTHGTYAGSTGNAVTNNATNYVYLDSTGTLQINTTGFPAAVHARLATVVCSGGVITSIVDEREQIHGTATGGVSDHDSLTGVTANQHHNQVHGLGSSDHNTATLAELNAKVSDATLDDSGDSRPPTTHGLGSASHSAATLAQLNALVSDATLDDSSSSRPPSGAASGDLGGTYPSPTVNDGADSTAIHDNETGEINAVAESTSPAADDVVLAEYSLAGYAKRRIKLRNLPSGGATEGHTWAYSTTTTEGDPGTAVFRLNNATLSLVTEMYVDDFARSGVNFSSALLNLAAGAHLYIQEVGDRTHYGLYEVTSVTDQTGYVKIAVTHKSSSGSFALNVAVAFDIFQDAGGGGATDEDAIHDNVSGEINAVTEKTDPLFDDLVLIEDSEATYAKKKVKLGLVGDGQHYDVKRGSDFSTTSTTFQDAMVWTPTLTVGRYAAFFMMELDCSVGNCEIPFEVFDGYEGTGGQSVDAGLAIPINNENQKTSGYTHSTSTNPSEVTVANAGTYKITYSVSIDVGSGNKASNYHARLEKDSGSGFSEITGSRSYAGLLQSDACLGTLTRTVIVDLAAGDKIRIYAIEDSGLATGLLEANGSGLTIERVDVNQTGLVHWQALMDGNIVALGTCAIPFSGEHVMVTDIGLWTFSTGGTKTIKVQIRADATVGGTVYLRSESKMRTKLVKHS